MPASQMQNLRVILLYDNYCKWCTLMAESAAKLSRAYIRIVGHYSGLGRRVKAIYFNADDHPEEMFWLIKDDTAYGGRNGLLPLATEILRGMLA
jgi:hypothetical protein